MQQTDFRRRMEEIEREIQNRLSRIGKKIAVMSGKGGVGKSTVSALLAVHFAKEGKSVAIFDADFLGPSIPKIFGLDDAKLESSEYGLLPAESKKYKIKIMSLHFLLPQKETPVIWRGPLISGALKDLLAKTDWGILDYMIFDLPPGTGDIPITLMQSVQLDGVILVASPTELTSMIVEKALNMAKKMDSPVLGIVENMSYYKCPNCGYVSHIFGKNKTKELAEKYGLKILAEIPVDPELAELVDMGEIESYEKDYFSDINI